MKRDLSSAVFFADRFEPVIRDLENGARVMFFDAGDSNEAQLTYHGHWVSAGLLWSQRYGQYGGRIVRSSSDVGSVNADTGYMTSHNGVFDSWNPDATSPNSAIPPTLALVSSNTDGANGGNTVRFVDKGLLRLATGVLSPLAPANFITGNSIVAANVINGGVANSANLNFVEDGGNVAYSFLIPPVSGGTLNVGIRVGIGLATIANASHNTKQDAVVDTILQFPADAGTGARQFQLNRISVNNSVGEVFFFGCQFLRANVQGRTLGVGPGGVAWSPLWMVGGQALAHFAHDIRAQNPLAVGEYFRQAYRFAQRVVVRLKHKGNDTAAAGIFSIDINGVTTTIASSQKRGYWNNFNYVCRKLYEAAIAVGVPADKFHILAGGYHGRPIGSGYDLQRDYENAECEVASSGTPWAKRITVVKGWELATFAEMQSRLWFSDGGAHMNKAGYDGFNMLEMAALHHAVGRLASPRDHRVGSTRLGPVP